MYHSRCPAALPATRASLPGDKLLLQLDPVDLLETARQLVAAPPAFATVVLKILARQAQVAFARMHHQRGTGRQYRVGHHKLLARGDTRTGNADDLVALALGQLRKFGD